jgi:hypothetical protein
LAHESLTDIGAGDGTQTRDLMITNQLLYQLSYTGLRLPRLATANKNTTKTSDFVQASMVKFYC